MVGSLIENSDFGRMCEEEIIANWHTLYTDCAYIVPMYYICRSFRLLLLSSLFSCSHLGRVFISSIKIFVFTDKIQHVHNNNHKNAPTLHTAIFEM